MKEAKKVDNDDSNSNNNDDKNYDNNNKDYDCNNNGNNDDNKNYDNKSNCDTNSKCFKKTKIDATRRSLIEQALNDEDY